MSKSKKLIFFGTEAFSVSSLIMLIASGYDIAAVVTKPDAPAGRGQRMNMPKVKEVAINGRIKVYQPQKLSDIKADLLGLKPTHGVLAAYGRLIPQDIIDIFPGGIINVHPSLLPKYRGPSPVEAAILNADKETGVSLMKLTAGMDEGPVYAVRKIKLTGLEEGFSFSLYLAAIGTELLSEKMLDILGGKLQPKVQDDSKASYTKLLKKDDGWINWSKPAEVYERQVRAYLGFPKSKAKIYGHEAIITKTRVAKSKDDGALVLECQPGWLEVLELIAPSGRTISGTDFIRGYNPSQKN